MSSANHFAMTVNSPLRFALSLGSLHLGRKIDFGTPGFGASLGALLHVSASRQFGHSRVFPRRKIDMSAATADALLPPRWLTAVCAALYIAMLGIGIGLDALVTVKIPLVEGSFSVRSARCQTRGTQWTRGLQGALSRVAPKALPRVLPLLAHRLCSPCSVPLIG